MKERHNYNVIKALSLINFKQEQFRKKEEKQTIKKTREIFELKKVSTRQTRNVKIYIHYC